MTDAEADEAIALALEFEPKASLDEMIQTVRDRSWTLQGNQRARLIADMLSRPIPEAVREIAVLTQLETFLELIKQRPAEVARRLQAKGARANVEA